MYVVTLNLPFRTLVDNRKQTIRKEGSRSIFDNFRTPAPPYPRTPRSPKPDRTISDQDCRGELSHTR